MSHLHLILYVLAFVMFLLAVWPGSPRFNLIAAGLAALTLTLIL